jgi:hypothetical protein
LQPVAISGKSAAARTAEISQNRCRALRPVACGVGW